MNLSWVHDKDIGLLTCIINENLKYTTLNGGGSLVKTFNEETHDILTNEAWEDEKHWISDNFSDVTGVYNPQLSITLESWKVDHPDWSGAVPLFGITDDGLYLDKLARTSWFQEGLDMTKVYCKDNVLIEQDSNGEYWQRLWCEELDLYYNLQPCCVFPNNPGRKKMTTAEAESYILGETE